MLNFILYYSNELFIRLKGKKSPVSSFIYCYRTCDDFTPESSGA